MSVGVEACNGGLVGSVTAAGSDGDHFDGVGIVIVGQKPVDDPEPFRAYSWMIEAEPSSPAEVTRDVAVTEPFACLAPFGQVGDGLESGIDKLIVDLGERAEVIKHVWKQSPMVGTGQRFSGSCEDRDPARWLPRRNRPAHPSG